MVTNLNDVAPPRVQAHALESRLRGKSLKIRQSPQPGPVKQLLLGQANHPGLQPRRLQRKHKRPQGAQNGTLRAVGQRLLKTATLKNGFLAKCLPAPKIRPDNKLDVNQPNKKTSNYR
ncbi:unnamed protein product [Mesocestoides corti]|uniref:Uncharacterized protein n=1 Tax=Mesocestoides corti TaxID=53468 RepID=A0A0R3U1U4_MESCO|nr:unnamed protein product [Mesocestoides corti]